MYVTRRQHILSRANIKETPGRVTCLSNHRSSDVRSVRADGRFKFRKRISKRHFSPRRACRKLADRRLSSVHRLFSQINETTQRGSGPHLATSRREEFPVHKNPSPKSFNFRPSPATPDRAAGRRPVVERTVVRHGRPIGSRVTSSPASCRAQRLAGRRAGPRPRRAAPTAIMNANAGASGTPVGLNVRGRERESDVDLVFGDFPSVSFPSLRFPLDSSSSPPPLKRAWRESAERHARA